MAYSTSQDYAAQFGLTVEELPTDIDASLERASVFIAGFVLQPIDLADASHVTALRGAVNARVRRWAEDGKAAGAVKSRSRGSLSISYNVADPTPQYADTLSPEEVAWLRPSGLLYAGVGTA